MAPVSRLYLPIKVRFVMKCITIGRAIVDTRTLLMALAILMGVSRVAEAAVGVDEVVTAQREYFTRLRSLDAYCTIDQSTSSSQGSPVLHDLIRIRKDGALFRVDTRIAGSAKSPEESGTGETVAFNLERHQWFQKNDLLLRTSDSAFANGYIDNISFLQPFEPAVPAVSRRTFEQLSPDSEIWRDLREVAQTDDSTVQYAGHPCCVLSIVKNSVLTYKWYCAQDLGLYPVGFEAFHNNKVVGERYTITDVRKIATSEGEVIVPVAAEMDWFTLESKPLKHFAFGVDESTLQVNKSINNDIFTLDPSLALTVQDVTNPEKSYSTELRAPSIVTRPVESAITPKMPDAGGSSRESRGWLIAISGGVMLLGVVGGSVMFFRRYLTRKN